MVGFEVLMPVYLGDDADAFKVALGSLTSQTLLPTRILIVCDGPVSVDIDLAIQMAMEQSPGLIEVLRHPTNMGLGKALALGLSQCTEEYVARMDSDDISRNDRFEKQIAYLEMHPEVDLLGSNIREFDDEMANLHGYRQVPLSHDDIYRHLSLRNAFNHVTVIFRRNAALAAGNYRDQPFFEDYYLWLRMRARGARFANISANLVDVRGGLGMLSRRGGSRYIEPITAFLKSAKREELIGSFAFAIQFFARIAVAMVPNRVREQFYRRVLRNRV